MLFYSALLLIHIKTGNRTISRDVALTIQVLPQLGMPHGKENKSGGQRRHIWLLIPVKERC